MKNKLFVICTTLVLLFSGMRILRYYKIMVPLTEPGRCLSVELSDGVFVKMIVLSNDPKTKSSSVIVLNVPSERFPLTLSYETLRKMQAMRSSCE